MYVIAGRGGGVQETSIRPFGQWELLSIHNISSVASEPERAAEARSAVVASKVKFQKVRKSKKSKLKSSENERPDYNGVGA